jgi:tRNA(Ile2) C34 agmatinyltransferase TiaS
MIVCPACGGRHADAGFRCAACGFAPEVSGGIHLLAPALARGTDGTPTTCSTRLSKPKGGTSGFARETT